jgi:cytochrome oxidase assembly protein ShyY1
MVMEFTSERTDIKEEFDIQKNYVIPLANQDLNFHINWFCNTYAVTTIYIDASWGRIKNEKMEVDRAHTVEAKTQHH